MQVTTVGLDTPGRYAEKIRQRGDMMADFDSTQWLIFIAGTFVSVISGSILILALYFRFINRDDIDNTDESNGPELAVSRRRPHTYR